MSDTEPDRLLLDYNQTTDLIHTLTDVRFKLLALAPTITGTAVALLSRGHSAAELLAVGTLGLTATLGLLTYELRTTQLHDYAIRRARTLEQRIGIRSLTDPTQTGGLYSDEPVGELSMFGIATAAPERGHALIYGAVIGGWSYLVAWGAFHALGATHAQPLGGLIGAVVAALCIAGFLRVGAHHEGPTTHPRPARADEPRAPLADV